MLELLDRIEAIVVSPGAAPDDRARALAELGRAVDPELSTPSPQTAQVFARALDLIGRLKADAEGLALAECLLSIAKYTYVSQSRHTPRRSKSRSNCAIRTPRRRSGTTWAAR